MENKANPNTIKDLDLQIQKFQQQRQKEIAKEIRAILKSMRSLGISLVDLSSAGAKDIKSGGAEVVKKPKGKATKKVSKAKSGPKGADGRSQVKPKYQDPVTNVTWTGRGLVPGWMDAYEKAGRSRSEFEIKA